MQSIGLPPGFRDVLFKEAKQQRMIEGKIAVVLDSLGYGELAPSAIEFLELYSRGEQSVKNRTFRFLDRDDNLLALRADFTPAIARIVSGQLANAPRPVKVWYSGTVFRKVDRNQGRFCEIRQIGAELLGLDSVDRDVEILNAAMVCLESIGITDVQVHVNHAGIFRGIVNSLSLDDHGRDLLRSEIDRKDARALASRLETLGVSQEQQKEVATVSRCVGGVDALRLAESAIKNPESRGAIDNLIGLASGLERWKEHVVFDLTEIDELEYYTGVMFEIFSPKLTSELGKGGRYDSLLKEFGLSMPAVGFSFSMERLVELV